MRIRQACAFYDISKGTLKNWLKDTSIQPPHNKPPSKIHNDALLKNIEQYPDDYMYERAQRFGCSKSGIEAALKRLGNSKKTLEYPKYCSVKRAKLLKALPLFI